MGEQHAPLLGNFPVDLLSTSTVDLDMRGKIHLLRAVCAQLSNEVHQYNAVLTSEERETVVSCVQELEEYVLPCTQENQAARSGSSRAATG
jgi:hypothetical protein